MWRRPTESGISFICILAPTRFFVKSIKINIARRGLKISLPASSSSPLPSFWQAKTRFYFFLTGSGNPGSSRNKKNAPRGAHFFIFSRNFISSEAMKAHSANSGLPRAENLFARKFLQPAFEFLTGQKLASISSSQAQANQLAPDTKKMHPAGRIFSSFHETLFLAQERKNIL